MYGTRKKNQKITSTRGIERIRFTYPPASIDSGLKLESRIIASRVPKMMPPVMASSVSVTVKVMPSRKRYAHERWMTSKSNPESISVSRRDLATGRDEPRDAHLAREESHADHHQQVGEQVEHRRRRERLEDLEAHFL